MTELTRPTRTIVNVPDGMQPLVLARLVEERLKAEPDAAAAAVFVARDGRRWKLEFNVRERVSAA